MKKVGVIMGSDSDLPVVEKCINELKKYEIPTEVHVYSAHRTPVEAIEFAQNARYHSTTADRFAGAALPTVSSRRQNGTFHQRSVGRRLPMRQGGRIHDD